jgi:hypothetical protein
MATRDEVDDLFETNVILDNMAKELTAIAVLISPLRFRVITINLRVNALR